MAETKTRPTAARVKRMSDVDAGVLRELVRASVAHMRATSAA